MSKNQELKNEVTKVVENGPKNIAELWTLIDERLKKIEEKMESRPTGRGPKSTRTMTEDDAKKVMTGELKNKSIKDAAAELGLSYGQIYSARNGYTFKGIYAEMTKK